MTQKDAHLDTKTRKYDDELFEGTAGWYEQYRPRYAPELYTHLRTQYNLTPHATVLDLGCGTGFLARGLAPHVGKVFGVDPDESMLEEARTQSTQEGLNAVEWVRGAAESLPGFIDDISLTTIGTAFHWMRQEEVLATLHERTVPGGGVALITSRWNYWKDGGKEHTIPWKKKRLELVQRYLGDKRRAGNGLANLDTKEVFEALLARSAFSRFQTWEQSFEHTWTTETLLGLLYSTSFGRRAYFGERLSEFEQVFTEEMLQTEPSGRFVDTITTNALLVWK